MPDQPSAKNYEDLVKLMMDHLQPPPSKISERYKFKKCAQQESKSIKVLCAKL